MFQKIMYIMGMDKYVKRAWVGGVGSDEAYVLILLFQNAKKLFSKLSEMVRNRFFN